VAAIFRAGREGCLEPLKGGMVALTGIEWEHRLLPGVAAATGGSGGSVFPHRSPVRRGVMQPSSLIPSERRERSILNGRSAAQNKSPGSAPRALFRSRNRSYLLTFILACRSVGRTIGNGGLVTTSLTQRASPPLK
jgi:hypothetical protein